MPDPKNCSRLSQLYYLYDDLKGQADPSLFSKSLTLSLRLKKIEAGPWFRPR